MPSPETTAETSEPSETPAEASAPEETPAEADNASGLSRGTWSGDVYTSEFAGIQFTLPEGWLIATDEEIANVAGLGADIMGDDMKWAIEAAKQATIYDMMAKDPIIGNNVIIMYENLSMFLGGTSLTEEDYLELLKEQIKTLETLSYTFDEPYETKVNGISYQMVRAYEENNNLTQYYLMHKQDKYMVVIVITVVDDSIDAVLSQFK